ncbi:MAG: flippase [Actinomycetota bacterium]|nr:flippase [Actinomycetota bacterium]
MVGDILVQIVGRLANLVPGVVVTLLLAHELGQQGFGEWSTIFAVIQIATIFTDFGLEQVAVRRAAADPSRESDWIGALVSLRLAIAAPIMLVTAGVLVLIAETSDMRIAGAVMSLVLIASAPTGFRATFQLRLRNSLSMVVLTVNSVLWTAGVVLIAARDGGLVPFAIAFVFAAAVSSAVNAVLALRISKVNLRTSVALWRELARVALPLGIAGVMITAYVRLDQILLFVIAGARDAGLYGAAYRILDQSQFIPLAVVTTLFPIISAAWPRDAERVRMLSQTILDYLSLLSFPVLGFSIVAAKPFMEALFGHGFAAAAPALPLLMAAFVCISLAHLGGSMLLVLGFERRLLTYSIVALVINVVLNVILIPPFGFVAAAAVTFITELVVLLVSLRTVFTTIELRPGLARIGRVVLAATGMSVLVGAGRSGGVPLWGLVAIAAVSYTACVLILRVVSVQEVRELLALRRAGGDKPAVG